MYLIKLNLQNVCACSKKIETSHLIKYISQSNEGNVSI